VWVLDKLQLQLAVSAESMRSKIEEQRHIKSLSSRLSHCSVAHQSILQLHLGLYGMAAVLYNKLDLIGSWHTMPSIRYLVGALIMGLCVAAWRVRQYRYTCATVKTKPVLSDKKEPVITPLGGFDWEKTEPLQFRPFKGKEKFNLTMCEYLFIT
jgi:hypothetical protein